MHQLASKITYEMNNIKFNLEGRESYSLVRCIFPQLLVSTVCTLGSKSNFHFKSLASKLRRSVRAHETPGDGDNSASISDRRVKSSMNILRFNVFLTIFEIINLSFTYCNSLPVRLFQITTLDKKQVYHFCFIYLFGFDIDRVLSTVQSSAGKCHIRHCSFFFLVLTSVSVNTQLLFYFTFG